MDIVRGPGLKRTAHRVSERTKCHIELAGHARLNVAVARYRASNTYVRVTAGYVFEKQLHGYVVYLQIYVRLLIARHGAAGQGMYC